MPPVVQLNLCQLKASYVHTWAVTDSASAQDIKTGKERRNQTDKTASCGFAKFSSFPHSQWWTIIRRSLEKIYWQVWKHAACRQCAWRCKEESTVFSLHRRGSMWHTLIIWQIFRWAKGNRFSERRRWSNEYKTFKHLFTAYFMPQQNSAYEIYKFR